MEKGVGVVLGAGVGDALGLPREGLSARRAGRMFGGALRHRLVLGRGMVSDDTEHAVMTAGALAASGGDVERFGKLLGWGLRWWILRLPAGVGLATLRACVKLWLGFGVGKSGVWSAGNGPAMRAGVIGAYAHDRLKLMRELVAVSTRVTHRDPQALEGALAVARAAAFAVGCAGVMDVEGCVRFVVEGLGDEGLRRRVERAGAAAREGISAEAFAGKMGCFGKVTGYMYHTVPAALYAVFCHPGDFCGAVERVIGMGGDTDSTAAIVGGIMGLVAGEGGIPREWVEGVWDWPLGTRGMREAGEMLARGASGEGVRMGWGFWRGVVTMMRTAGVWKVVDVDLDAGEGEGTFGRFVREHPEGGEVGK